MKKALLILVIVATTFAMLGCSGIFVRRAQLKEIVVDGRLINGFKPFIYKYTYVVPNDYEGMPTVIGIPAKANYTVSYHYPDELPGIITISVTPGSHPGTKLKETFYRINVFIADGI